MFPGQHDRKMPPMTMAWIIGKFLDDETLLEGGNAAVRKVVAELGDEGVTVFASTVATVQKVMRDVLALQRERVPGLIGS
jgi:hypothetical protein